jgi:transcriptional regulator with XRE-family HTH domain
MDSVIDLEQLKKARGLRSQSDVAKQLGITRQQVWNYEKGESEPPLKVLMKMADLYGIRVEKLLAQKNLSEQSKIT